MNTGNWQRDLLRIVLYGAGVIVAFLAIPTFIVGWITLIKAMSAMNEVSQAMSQALGGGMGSLGDIGWLLVLQPALQILVGILLARWSGWFARVVFPDQHAASGTPSTAEES
jgi:hypothetical protein